MAFKRCPQCGKFLRKDGGCTNCGYEPNQEVIKVDEAREVVEVRTADIVAAEIVQMVDQTRKLVINNSIEIGKRLCEAKEMVPHGEWTTWLKNKVRFSQSTAQNLMRIYKEYGAAQGELWGASAKSQAFGKLDYSKAVALLAVPADEREQFIEDKHVDEMSTRQLQEAIKARDEALEKSESYKLAADTLREEAAAAKKAAQEAKTALESANDSLTTQEAIAENYQNSIKILEENLKVAKSQQKNDEVAGLEENLAATQEKLNVKNTEIQKEKETVKKLREQLKEALAKPAQVTTKTVEVVPDSIKAELEELRAKLKKSEAVNGNEAALKFKIHFEGFQNSYNIIMEDIEGVSDPALKNKFQAAVVKILAFMHDNLDGDGGGDAA